MLRPSLFAILCASVLAACASKKTPSDTTASGTVALSSFASPPTSVVATGAAGREVRGTIGVNGAFSVVLPKGDHYALSLETSTGRVPIAMPRRSGRLDKTFAVTSAGVVITLGSVRYRAAGSTTELRVAAQGAACNPNGTGDYECVQDDEQSSCEGGDDGQQDNGADGECVNGIDSKTHAACTDPPDDAEQVDAKIEMAVPERSAPVDASGCEGGDESD